MLLQARGTNVPLITSSISLQERFWFPIKKEEFVVLTKKLMDNGEEEADLFRLFLETFRDNSSFYPLLETMFDHEVPRTVDIVYRMRHTVVYDILRTQIAAWTNLGPEVKSRQKGKAQIAWSDDLTPADKFDCILRRWLRTCQERGRQQEEDNGEPRQKKRRNHKE